LTPIRLRVLNVFKNWLDKHFSDFMEDRSLVSSFLQFVKKNSEIENELAIEKTLEQVIFLFFSFLFFSFLSFGNSQ